ncbi:MAG TPA: sigma-70 family RNA polymerase sigma factor [Lacipirellulaceae bacterium]|jgi:RNA polymerase sigma-70 factor (ECF subfamily)|nr:sigma-70 family RNA polymerase sigma factor [Lacipirellulaceae bacterium]
MIDCDEVVRREGSAVWRTAYRLVRNRADADECYQEAFLAAVELSNRQPVHNWPALLQRLATTRAIDRVRKRLRRKVNDEISDTEFVSSVGEDPSRHAEAAELASDLRWAIAQVPKRQAEVFCLHELGDWSYQDIANQLGITVNSVGVILHRTKQKLRQLWKCAIDFRPQ